MKKTIQFFFFLAAGTLNPAQAQKQGQARIDSLLMQLPNAKEDTNKVILLNDLCFTSYSINPDEGLRYGNLALELAKKLNWKQGIANATGRIGTNYFGKADYPNTLEHWLKALQLNEELQNKKAIGINLGNIGNVYLIQSDFAKALEYYSRATKINEETGNMPNLALNYGNIGTVYGSLSNHTKALEYFQKALHIYEQGGDPGGIARNLVSIGNVYMLQKDYAKALEYGFKALKMTRESGDKNLYAIGLTNIGKTYSEIATDSNRLQLNILFAGDKRKSLQKAFLFTDSATTISKEIGDLRQTIEDYKSLSEIQTLLGDNTGALESYKNYTLYKDSVFNIEKDKKLTQTAMQYEFDKKEAATKAEQEKKDIRQRNIRNSIVAGLAGALVFLTVVYRQRNKISKEKKRSEALLLNILPAETAEELKNTGTTTAKDFSEVTVLFTDFKNFTAMSENLTAQELVNEINYCYSAFDNIITRHGIEKIKTIGDSYMCAGGLPVTNNTHAEATVRAALEIRDFIKNEKQKREIQGKSFFEIRIGCNTGPVVAGIVGIKKFAYDIWGDTVNIASRMESSGEPGKVNISGSTYELVKDKFSCTYRGKIEAKNKGMIDMYFVEG